MKKLIQLLGCLTLVFLFSCSDDDPKVIPAPDSVYHAFAVSAPNKDAGSVAYELADHKNFGDVAYVDFMSTYAGGTYVFKPYEYALFCNSESYCSTMPSVPVYTLESVEKINGENLQPLGVSNGSVDNSEIKFEKVDEGFQLVLPAMEEGLKAYPEFRITFSCNFGENSPYNNVKAYVYVSREVEEAE